MMQQRSQQRRGEGGTSATPSARRASIAAPCRPQRQSVQRHAQQDKQQLRRQLAAPPQRRASVAVSAIHIDRRQHLENSWRRQAERETLLQQTPRQGEVLEIRDLEHLESVLEKVGSQLLVVFLYTNSCGACKAAHKRLEALCSEASRARVRAVFAKHNVIDDYDHWSDISRWHRARVVPTFLFFDGGALVQRLTLRDVRRMTGPAPVVQKAMEDDLHGIAEAFRRVVFKAAPGSRS